MNEKQNRVDEITDFICQGGIDSTVNLPAPEFKPTHLKKSSILANKYAGKSAGNQVLPLMGQKSQFNHSKVASSSSSKLDSEPNQSLAKQNRGRLWRVVKSKLDDLTMIRGLDRDMIKNTFSGKEASKISRHECSIYHEGLLIDFLHLIRSVSLILILILMPLQ